MDLKYFKLESSGNNFILLDFINTEIYQFDKISNFIFTLLLAGVIALSIKMIGALLITGLLLIPAAIARNISSSPRQMVIIATLAGVVSVIAGLFVSLEINTSSGPSIIVVALLLFIISLIPLEIKGQLQK